MAFTQIIINALGNTDPPIESKTAVILIQDGEVSVMRFILEELDHGHFYLEPPRNALEVDTLA